MGNDDTIEVKVARHDEQIKTLFRTTEAHDEMIKEMRQESKARDKWLIGILGGVACSCVLLLINLLAGKL